MSGLIRTSRWCPRVRVWCGVAGRGRQLTPLMWGGSWLRQLRTAGGCHCTGAVVVIRSESRSSLLTSGAFCGRSETAAARPHLGDGRWPRSPNRRRAEKCRTLGALQSRSRDSRGRGPRWRRAQPWLIGTVAGEQKAKNRSTRPTQRQVRRSPSPGTVRAPSRLSAGRASCSRRRSGVSRNNPDVSPRRGGTSRDAQAR